MARKASGNRFPVEKMFYRTVKVHTIKYLVWNGGSTEERVLENVIGRSAEKIVQGNIEKGELLLTIISDEVKNKIAYMTIEKFMSECEFWENSDTYNSVEKENKIK